MYTGDNPSSSAADRAARPPLGRTATGKRRDKGATFARSRTPATDELATQYGDNFHFEPLDATDAAGINAFVARVCDMFGGALDSLVNNAAIGQDHC